MPSKTDPMRDHPMVKTIKRMAKEIEILAPDIKHMHALELAARAGGFRSYASFRASLKKQGEQNG